MASEIRVDKINSLSGVGTVTLSPTGVDIAGITTVATFKVGTGVTASSDGDIFATGVCTATTFSGSGASLTNLPAANITGTLPAISGANLTNLDASDLASGTVPTARLGSGTASSSTFLAGDSTFKTVTGTTINSNADNRLITGSGTANTLNGESGLTFDGTTLTVAGASNATQAIFSGTGGSGSRGLEIKTESGGATDEVVILKTRASGTTGAIKLQTNGANCLTLAGNGGDVTVHGGNLVIGTGGKGIDFSATGDGGGSSSNVSELLDDYEEGNFVPYMAYSPTSNDPAYSFQSGFYVKIGKLVTFQARINLTSAGTGSANLKITNFPFAPTPSSGGLSNPMVTIKPVVGVDVGGDREIFAQFEGGNSSLVLYTFGIESSSDYASFTQSNIDNDAQVAIFGHYYTAS